MADQDPAKKSPLLARLAFYYLVIFGCLVIGFGIAYLKLPPFQAIDNGFNQLTTFFKGTPEEEKTTLERLTLHRQEFRQNKYDPGFNLRDSDFVDPGFLLISEFSKEHNQTIIRLVKVDGFEELYSWIPPVEEILDQTRRDTLFNNMAGFCAQHPLLLTDGSVVFTSGQGPLVKIDRDSEVVWTINRHFHHSIEVDQSGNFVVPIVNEPSFSEELSLFRDDAIAIVSPEGEILEIRSIGELLVKDDRFVGAFYGVGYFFADRVHLNDIQPILEDIGTAKKGDLALSLRNLSLIMLYRPSTNKIIWGRLGPWIYQHDVNILPNGSFSVFSNNAYSQFLGPETSKKYKPYSEVYVFDPETDKLVSPYEEQMASVDCFTPTAGRARVLPNGDVFLEQSDFCRLIRLSNDRIRWEYTNMAADDTQGLVHWCRYYGPQEIDLEWLEGNLN